MNEKGSVMNPSFHIVLVCDIHNFTGIAREIDDRVPSFMDEFYHTIGDIAVSRGGRIIKYIGDCIFFIFKDSRYIDAVQSAVEMREAFELLLSRYRIRCESELETGLSAGEVHVGEIGHPTLRGFEIFGTAVNEASYIGCHRGIAITAAVKKHIESQYEVRQLPDITLKRHKQPLSVWEIVGYGNEH